MNLLGRGFVGCWLAVALATGLGCEDEKPKSFDTGAPSDAAPAPTISVPAPPSATPEAPPTELAAKSAPDRLVVIAGGDVNLGREAGQSILSDPDYNPFIFLAPLLASGDLRFVNLESQLSDQNGETQSPLNRLIFTGPPGGARVLARAGIDIVSVANNHAWDYQKSAFFETLDNLSRAGVAYAGGSKQPEQQYKPTILEIKGWHVAVFAVTQIWNQGPFEKHAGRHYVAWARYDRLYREIKRAKQENDLVIVSYHGGGEYIDMPLMTTREFVKVVMKAGVDVVFGHHPHVVHGVSWFGERAAFYSLGNLVFNQHKDHPWTSTGFLARVTFERNARPKFQACPFVIVGHTPTPLIGKEKQPLAQAFRRHLKFVSVTVGGSEVSEPNQDGCMDLSPP